MSESPQIYECKAYYQMYGVVIVQVFWSNKARVGALLCAS